MASQRERMAATRAALVGAALESFLELGFEATKTETILARARVSRGALYHHFATKTDLLAAVFEQVTSTLVTTAEKAARAKTSPRAALIEALTVWFHTAATEPVPRRVVLEIGPAILGMARARDIEDAITQPPIRRAIVHAIKSGEVRCDDEGLVSRLLSALVAELAMIAVERRLEPAEMGQFDLHIVAVVSALLPNFR